MSEHMNREEMIQSIIEWGTDMPQRQVTEAVKNMNTWLARGDGVAMYENQALGHPGQGDRQFISYGSPAAQLETPDPPRQLPDIGGRINWPYQLVGTYRGEPLDVPTTTITEDGVTYEIVTFWCALDGFEPPRKENYGRLYLYVHPTKDTPGIKIKDVEANQFSDATKAIYLIDDGKTVVPHYVVGWRNSAGLAHGALEFLLLEPFPTNPDDRRASDGRVIDFMDWALGPRRAYHLKVNR
jgi:hypothetical protein